MRFFSIIIATALLSMGGARAADPTYAISGANIGVLSDTKMVVEPFSYWAWGPIGTPGFSGMLAQSNATIYPDLTTIGLNGMDVNPNGTGNMPPDGAYVMHAYFNPATGDTAFITSASPLSAASPPAPGYTHYRKMMYGAVVKGGKLVNNHVSHWPMPSIYFTDVETDTVIGTYTAPTGGWVPIDLKKLIPEHSRFGIFRAIIAGGTADIYLSPSNVQPGNRFWKSLARSQRGVTAQMKVRVDGAQIVYVWIDTPGATITLMLDGFDMTEVD